ncbi:MaoC/PaaZ C-terminal domain-containing protein [Mycolicibacterium litorale]|jgi:acyl dehydratase|uniref:MaoC/PaaZ C-terminal domain-containing protein n=1 Tax=Mycolicibacterium litorale TaxID=758802 RepID=UPI00346C739A
MPDDDLRFNPDGLGKWTDPTEFDVTADKIAAYAAATNDPIAEHRTGETASPVFAIVPVFESLMEPALGVVPLELLGKVVHAGHDFRFHRPIRAGDRLVARTKMDGYRGGAKGTVGSGIIKTLGNDGELVNTQVATLFVRGFDAGEAVGDVAPANPLDERLRDQAPVAKVVQHIDDDQTFRYSEAAGDPMPIHLDEEFAKATGLPGIIAHGMCTLAFASWAVLTEVGGSDTARLRRLAVRFAKPVLPGREIETTVWNVDTANDVTTYAFETTQGGIVVLTDGIAEITN